MSESTMTGQEQASEPRLSAAGSEASPVRYAVDGGIALLTLSRPHRRNGWTPGMQQAYYDRLEQASADPDVRVVVLTGEGASFCVGADMDVLGELGRNAPDPDRYDARGLAYPLTLRKPLLAAINGACAGVGLVQALMADLRFAAAGAKLTTSFAQRGLVAEYGSAWLLPRVVGHSAALDLLLSGRVVLAEEALRMRLVDRVVPAEDVLEVTMAYARELVARCSPASMAVIKAQVYADADTGPQVSAERALALMLQSFSGPDFVEGVTSYLQKRLPEFAPLDSGSRFRLPAS